MKGDPEKSPRAKISDRIQLTPVNLSCDGLLTTRCEVDVLNFQVNITLE